MTVETTRTNTPDEATPNGKRITVKRACNGCGRTLGDVTATEVEQAIAGEELADVRGECPACSSTLHHVFYEVDEFGNGSITFTCRGDDTADCHIYPACSCESWDRDTHMHPSVVHDRCWMQDWFDNNCVSYGGDDGNDCQPPARARGAITASFDTDYITWEWATTTTNGEDPA